MFVFCFSVKGEGFGWIMRVIYEEVFYILCCMRMNIF